MSYRDITNWVATQGELNTKKSYRDIKSGRDKNTDNTRNIVATRTNRNAVTT